MLSEHTAPLFIEVIAYRIEEEYHVVIDLEDEDAVHALVRSWLVEEVGAEEDEADLFCSGRIGEVNPEVMDIVCKELFLDDMIVDALRTPTSDEVLAHTLLTLIDEAEREEGIDHDFLETLEAQIRGSEDRDHLERVAIVLLGQAEKTEEYEYETDSSSENLAALIQSLPPQSQRRIMAVVDDEVSKRASGSSPKSMVPALARWREEYLSSLARRVLDELVLSNGCGMSGSALALLSGFQVQEEIQGIVKAWKHSFNLMNADGDFLLPDHPIVVENKPDGSTFFSIHPDYASPLRAVLAAEGLHPREITE